DGPITWDFDESRRFAWRGVSQLSLARSFPSLKASLSLSPAVAHVLGPVWRATPLPYGSFIADSPPVCPAHGGFMKRAWIAAAVAAVLWHVVMSAQQTGSIAGVVKDATGAVLPGVTVETSSPALIEKVRVTTTDGVGAYRIADLPPGVYTTTFSLGGF